MTIHANFNAQPSFTFYAHESRAAPLLLAAVLLFTSQLLIMTPNKAAARTFTTNTTPDTTPDTTKAKHPPRPPFTKEALRKLRDTGNSAEQTVAALFERRANLTPKAILLTLRQAGYTSTQTARAIESSTRINSARLTDLMFDQQYSVSQSCRMLRHVYQVDAKQALVQLSISGYNNQEIIQAVKSIYQLGNEALIVELSKGYAYTIEPNKNDGTAKPSHSNTLSQKTASRPPLGNSLPQTSNVKPDSNANAIPQPKSNAPHTPHHNKKLTNTKQAPKKKSNPKTTSHAPLPIAKHALTRSRQIASLMHKQGVQAELVAYLLKTQNGIQLAQCAQILRYVGYRDRGVFTALFNTYRPTSHDLIVGLISAGYRADQTLPFVIKNFSLTSTQLQRQLHSAGYPPIVVKRAMQSVHYLLVANNHQETTATHNTAH